MLRRRLGLPAPRSVGNIDWRRREKDEHEWVTNSLGFSLRLNKIEYYKEVGTLHYILSHGAHLDVPVIHRAIEAFTREQELWLKLAGDEKGGEIACKWPWHWCFSMFQMPKRGPEEVLS